jgi:hypothetical protein
MHLSLRATCSSHLIIFYFHNNIWAHNINYDHTKPSRWSCSGFLHPPFTFHRSEYPPSNVRCVRNAAAKMLQMGWLLPLTPLTGDDWYSTNINISG